MDWPPPSSMARGYGVQPIPIIGTNLAFFTLFLFHIQSKGKQRKKRKKIQQYGTSKMETAKIKFPTLNCFSCPQFCIAIFFVISLLYKKDKMCFITGRES
jgi:hypothetical protein